MAKTDFYKCYGASERNDALVCLSKTNYLLIFGYDSDEDGNFTWRKYYDHEPTQTELRADIDALINAQTQQTIINGLTWNGKPVWLSTENQMNFAAAYDLAEQSEGEALPMKLKLGEDADGQPVYHTFTSLNAFKNFATEVKQYVINCLQSGWSQKDSVDYSIFGV